MTSDPPGFENLGGTHSRPPRTTPTLRRSGSESCPSGLRSASGGPRSASERPGGGEIGDEGRWVSGQWREAGLAGSHKAPGTGTAGRSACAGTRGLGVSLTGRSVRPRGPRRLGCGPRSRGGGASGSPTPTSLSAAPLLQIFNFFADEARGQLVEIEFLIQWREKLVDDLDDVVAQLLWGRP